MDIVPERWAFSAIMPGLGFLRDVMTTPFLVHWTLADGWATSEQLPGIRVPGAPFMGVSGVAPSRQQVEAWTRREAERQNIRWPRFERSSYFIDPRYAAPERFIATMGMPVTPDGVNDGENLNLACRNAILNMMALLQDRGFSREQAYVICSVAVDLRISNVVDLPNVVVSALLPDAILSA